MPKPVFVKAARLADLIVADKRAAVQTKKGD
jgi:hypothetical protein